MNNWMTAGVSGRFGAAMLITAALTLPVCAFGEDRWEDLRGGFRDSPRNCNLTIIGLTADQKLVRLRGCDPTYPRTIWGISGLTGSDTKLVGIDYRVQDGKLYGVGNGGGIYVVDPASGRATKARQLTIALDGDYFGIDFNPAADALRILSNKGQNLRHPFADPTAATVLDGALNYTAGATATGITGAAYVNNDLSADTGTLLFDIDSALNQLALQVPPNAGSLVRVGTLTVDPDAPVGFDIYSKLRNGVTTENLALATFVVGGVTSLYEINLLTGNADRIDVLRDPVVDIAIPLEQRRQ